MEGGKGPEGKRGQRTKPVASVWAGLSRIFLFQEQQEQYRFELTSTGGETGSETSEKAGIKTSGKGSQDNQNGIKEAGSQDDIKGTGYQDGTKEASPQGGRKKASLTGGRKEPGSQREEQKRKRTRRSSLKKPLSVEERRKLQAPPPLEEMVVDPSLQVNRSYIEKLYSLPRNKDIIIRDIMIFRESPLPAFIVFMEGLAERTTINESVLKPLMLLSTRGKAINRFFLADYIKKNVVYGNQVEIKGKYTDIIEMINYGGTALFVEGCPFCLLIETKGWDRRSIGKPETEQVIRGPHEAFNETLRSNTALLRRLIRNTDLITELFKIGERNKTDVAVMYLKNLANPKLVEEVKRRIASISADYVGEVGVLEQFIEDHPFLPVPQVLTTERPDRVAASILDGKVAILMDGNPNALIVPVNLFALLHSPEDYYLRMPYGNLIRVLRVVAVFITLLTPAAYVSISSFHQEMIPTDLILAIAAARETVPFPTIIEVFLMEFAFEMIREAGVRIPGIIGNTLGIVGALILGQAAVQAGIVSPVLIIVVAVTGLASFAIPNYDMSFAFRGVRFIFTILSALLGFFGVSAGLFVLLIIVCSMKSFGVPMLVPVGPRTRTGPDIVLRGPMWSMEERLGFLYTQDKWRQPRISRGWLKKPGKREGGKRN